MRFAGCLFVVLLLCAQPVLSHAETVPSEEADDSLQTAHTMPSVIVRAQHYMPQETRINRSELDLIPNQTGSVTEALKGQSQVQYDYDQQSSLTVGEIAPPRISIAGAKPYENNFTIDGLSISNTLNPSGLDNSKSATDLTVGGGDMAIFYDTELIETVQVYSSSVPAQYGGFVGGVVDARLREPRPDRWRFKLKGRYTNDSWFDLRDVDTESSSPDNQPEFTTYKTGLSVDGPVNDYASLLLSISRHHSTIPLTRTDSDGTNYTDKQKRTSENYFARLTLDPHHDLKVHFDLTYAPYSALRWDPTFRNSEWTIENRSWRFATQFDYLFVGGVLTAKAAFTQYGFSRDSAMDYRYSGPDDQYGGLGDARNKNREVNSELSFVSSDFTNDHSFWNYAVGFEYGYKHADLWNQAITLQSVTSSRRTLQSYEEVSQSRHNTTLAGYAQVELNWDRLLIRPGLRIDHDRFSGNTDISPRFKSEYDLFGNNLLRVGVGINRYYGKHLSAYAFRRHRPIHTQIFDIQPDGSEVPRDPTLSVQRNYSSDGLSTPYSDELSGEISGSLPIFDYGISVVRRKHRRQLVSKSQDGTSYFLTNDGRGEYDAVSGYISRFFRTEYLGNHHISVSATKSKSHSSNGYFDSNFREDLLLQGYELDFDRVYYDGRFMQRSELPAENFNTPRIIALSLNSSFFDNRLRLLSVVRWRESSKWMVTDRRVNEDTPYGTISGSSTAASPFWINPEGGYSQAYKSEKIAGGAVTDLTIEFDLYHRVDRTFTLVTEIVNIFNDRVETGQAVDGMRILNHGRGFYAGFQMTF